MSASREWLTVVVLAFGIAGGAAADVEEILAAHFKAVGGLDRLSEVKTVRRTGEAQLHAEFGDMPGTFTELVVVGKKSYSNTSFGGGSEVTAWNGLEGWKTSPMTSTTVLEGMEAEGVKAAAFLDPLQGHYERDPSVLEQREDVTFQDVECSVIGIVGAEIDFYIDKASDLLVGVKLAYFDPMTGPVKAVMQFSDYVDYGGVMLPEARTLVLRDGAMTIEFTYAKTELDIELDETVFEKP